MRSRNHSFVGFVGSDPDYLFSHPPGFNTLMHERHFRPNIPDSVTIHIKCAMSRFDSDADNEYEYGLILAGKRVADDIGDGCMFFGTLGFMVSCIGFVAIEMGRITGAGAWPWFRAVVIGSFQALAAGK